MNKKTMIVLVAALIGLTACGNQRRRAADAMQEQLAAAVQQAAVDSIVTRFQALDSLTQKSYRVDAVFYPAAYRVKLTLEGKVYQLEQYPTASGFGYHNAEADLRGKGSEALLHFTDATMPDLKLTEIVR
jgi:type II secretory pathway pseudopilin PulG